jgi:citrate synthase
VDFYSGIIYQTLGFTPDSFTVGSAIPRTVGWLAQWQELREDPEQKATRPRQLYTGHDVREFVPIANRVAKAAPVPA